MTIKKIINDKHVTIDNLFFNVECGDIRTAEFGTIVHCCNNKGKLSTGVAGALRRKWPMVYNVYMNFYNLYGLPLGTIQPVYVADDLRVINIIGQDGYGYDGKKYVNYDAIDAALKKIIYLLSRGHIKHTSKIIHLPLIGCGLAGGKWNKIQEIIKNNLTDSGYSATLWLLD